MVSLGGGSLGKAAMDQAARNIPLQRMGTKCDIADCAVFAVSSAASYISGHTIVADGGCWMTEENNMDGVRRRLANAKL